MGEPANGWAAPGGGGQQPAKQQGPQQQPPKKPRVNVPTLLEEALVKPCEGCRKRKNRCTGGVPCVRCFDRLLRCEKRPLAALVPYPALAFASTDFASLAQAYIDGFTRLAATGHCPRPQALRLMRMWTDLVERAKKDVTQGAAVAVAQHFGIAPVEVQVETWAGQTLQWSDPLVSHGEVLHTHNVFRMADGGKDAGVAMWALSEHQAALAVNTGFESFLGTATMMSAWSTEYGALPAFLVAAVLAPEDRADFLRSLARVSFAPPPQAASLVVKGMDRQGDISLWILTLRSLILEDTRFCLLLRLERAPQTRRLCPRPHVLAESFSRYRAIRQFQLPARAPPPTLAPTPAAASAPAPAAATDNAAGAFGASFSVSSFHRDASVVTPLDPDDIAARSGHAVAGLAPMQPMAFGLMAGQGGMGQGQGQQSRPQQQQLQWPPSQQQQARHSLSSVFSASSSSSSLPSTALPSPLQRPARSLFLYEQQTQTQQPAMALHVSALAQQQQQQQQLLSFLTRPFPLPSYRPPPPPMVLQPPLSLDGHEQRSDATTGTWGRPSDASGLGKGSLLSPSLASALSAGSAGGGNGRVASVGSGSTGGGGKGGGGGGGAVADLLGGLAAVAAAAAPLRLWDDTLDAGGKSGGSVSGPNGGRL